MADPLVFTLHCQVEVWVADPDGLGELAVRDLRSSDIDWSREADDVETASAELRADPAMALAAMVDPERLIESLPGVTMRGGRVWAEANQRQG